MRTSRRVRLGTIEDDDPVTASVAESRMLRAWTRVEDGDVFTVTLSGGTTKESTMAVVVSLRRWTPGRQTERRLEMTTRRRARRN